MSLRVDTEALTAAGRRIAAAGFLDGSRWRRDHADRTVASGLIHHSDAGSHNTSIAFAETLVLEGFAASIGSVGDYDNALAETTIGLFKTEAVGRVAVAHFRPVRCARSTTWSTRRCSGSFDTTIAACTVRLTAFRPKNTRPRTTLTSRRAQPATPRP